MKTISSVLLTVLFALPTFAFSTVDFKQVKSEGIKKMTSLLSERPEYYYYAAENFYQLSKGETVNSVFAQIEQIDTNQNPYLHAPTIARSAEDFNGTLYQSRSKGIIDLASKKNLQVFTAADYGLPFYDFVLVFDPETSELYLSMSGND